MEEPRAGSSMRRRRRGARRAPPVLAALDLGTNNCRLLIATLRGDGRFRVLDSFSRIVRLGEGVAETGRLSDAAMARTLDALKICAQHILKSRASRIRAIATEAMRRAANADEFVARVKSVTGLTLEIVSAAEEAALAARGCAPLIGSDYAGAIAFDIGGGSTEIIWLEGHGAGAVIVDSASVPLGVVSLAEQKGQSFADLRSHALTVLTGVEQQMRAKRTFDPATHHLLGTSGTVTTLAGIAMGLKRYERARVDASWHDVAHILKIVDELAAMDLAGRAAIGCVGRDRADLIVPGSAIFSAICELWPCARLRVADRGLREGMLRELAARK